MHRTHFAANAENIGSFTTID